MYMYIMWCEYKDVIQKTHPKRDVYPLFHHSDQLDIAVEDLLRCANSFTFDSIAGLEATGMVFGSVLSYLLRRKFIAIRRAGKYPYSDENLYTESCTDYSSSEKRFEIPHTHIDAGERVLIVDDWIETGAQFAVAKRLLEQAGAHVVGGLFLGSTSQDILEDYEVPLRTVKYETE